MAITEGHYNIVLKGKYSNTQDVINSFFTEVHMDGGTLVGDDNELFGMGKRFWDAIKATLRAIVVGDTSFYTVEVFKADGADVGNSGFYTIPSDERAGLVAGDAMPPFVAWTFQLTRPNASFRHGYKRIGAVCEADQLRGIPTDDALDRLNDFADVLKGDIKLNDALINAPYMELALVQRIKNGQPVDPDVWYKPSTVVFKKIGSQNSRKYNVGS